MEQEQMTCGSCPAFIHDSESMASGRCFGCRSGPPQSRVAEPTDPFNWIPDRTLSTWWSCYVQLGGVDRCVSLSQCREQPEYFLFFRGDGNSGLIAGPADLAGAKAFAARWLFAHGATPA